MTMKWSAFLFLSVVAVASAGNVVINGVCRDCTPPVAETLIIGGQRYKGSPGHGTVIIGTPGAYPNALGPQPQNSYASPGPNYGAKQIEPGFSGRLPGGTYVHNTDCVNCDIRGGRDD